MLTLKAPIQLHIAQGLTGDAEAFGERIRGNYALLGARFTPKDLLLLLTAPPELPEDLGGMTTLVSQQTHVDARSVTLDVVNHVVNRILLDGTSQFTYQDQVYITSVLNRLGVNNVEQFMAQVRLLRTENENTVHLTRLYRAELARILERRAAGEAVPALPLPAERREEMPEASADPATAMSLSILRRLETASLYETIHAFQRSWSIAENHFHRNELRLAEQLRFSGAVSLAELKQQFFQQPQVQLLHHLNQYEAGTILEIPRDEEAVLSQAAAAALVTAVDNTVTEVLNRPQLRQEQWVRLENALWQTAENTLSRFETYHTQAPLSPGAVAQAAQLTWNHYAQELRDYLTVRQQAAPRSAEPGRLPGLSAAVVTQLTHLTRLEKDSVLLEAGQTNIQINQDQRRALLLELLETRSMWETQAPKPEEPKPFLYQEALRWTQERLRFINQRKQDPAAKPGRAGEPAAPPPPRLAAAEVPPPPAPPPMELTALEAEERAPELLVEELNRIDQRNRTIFAAVQQELRQRDAAPPTAAPDVQRTMQDALRALETPELVLRELYAAREPESAAHPAFTPREEALLRQADPATRALYERVLLYQKAPEAALAQGLVRPGNLGALHAELRQAMEPPAAVMEHVVRETELLREHSETVLERLRQLPGQYRPAEPPGQPPPAMRFVHRQAATDVSEELLERLEQQRTQQTVKTESSEEVARQNVRRTDLTQVERQMVTQTTEDITELVNRTLARQMRTISDQVYRQMEKRLQTERSRRGRL